MYDLGYGGASPYLGAPLITRRKFTGRSSIASQSLGHRLHDNALSEKLHILDRNHLGHTCFKPCRLTDLSPVHLNQCKKCKGTEQIRTDSCRAESQPTPCGACPGFSPSSFLPRCHSSEPHDMLCDDTCLNHACLPRHRRCALSAISMHRLSTSFHPK